MHSTLKMIEKITLRNIIETCDIFEAFTIQGKVLRATLAHDLKLRMSVGNASQDRQVAFVRFPGFGLVGDS